jgi:hypothetical protein
VFERFTERARQVVVLAQEEARTLGHDWLGTEHILLGLVREREGLASRVLANLGVTVEQVRAHVVRAIGAREGEHRAGQIPFTPEAKKVLERALREALSLGHNFIGTEHLLLALTREREGLAARILRELDIDAERVRTEVMGMLAEPRAAVARPVPDMDRSWLDFTPSEAFELTERLAPLSSRITFEVRRHAGEEPTFRVSAKLAGNDDVLRELVALEAHGIRAVLDWDRSVRLGHRDWKPPADADAPAADAPGADAPGADGPGEAGPDVDVPGEA